MLDPQFSQVAMSRAFDVAAMGKTQAWPKELQQIALAETEACSFASSPSHQSPNWSVYSTSQPIQYATQGI